MLMIIEQMYVAKNTEFTVWPHSELWKLYYKIWWRRNTSYWSDEGQPVDSLLISHAQAQAQPITN